MNKGYSVSLDTIVKDYDLVVVHRGSDYDKTVITNWDVARPGLPLAGFYDYFDASRVQVCGKLEITYLRDMTPTDRRVSLDRFMSSGIRSCIVAHAMPVPEEIDTAVALKKLAACRLSVDTLTPEQKKYLASWMI